MTGTSSRASSPDSLSAGTSDWPVQYYELFEGRLLEILAMRDARKVATEWAQIYRQPIYRWLRQREAFVSAIRAYRKLRESAGKRTDLRSQIEFVGEVARVIQLYHVGLAFFGTRRLADSRTRTKAKGHV